MLNTVACLKFRFMINSQLLVIELKIDSNIITVRLK
jgi:hypothetical protein